MYQAVVKRWTGTVWEYIGGSDSQGLSNGDASFLNLRLDCPPALCSPALRCCCGRSRRRSTGAQPDGMLLLPPLTLLQV